MNELIEMKAEIPKLVKQHNKYTKDTKTYARTSKDGYTSLRVVHKEYGTIYSYVTSTAVALECMKQVIEDDKEIASWITVDKEYARVIRIHSMGKISGIRGLLLEPLD